MTTYLLPIIMTLPQTIILPKTFTALPKANSIWLIKSIACVQAFIAFIAFLKVAMPLLHTLLTFGKVLTLLVLVTLMVSLVFV